MEKCPKCKTWLDKPVEFKGTLRELRELINFTLSRMKKGGEEEVWFSNSDRIFISTAIVHDISVSDNVNFQEWRERIMNGD